MAHGVPDWGVTNAPKTVYQVLEMGELAARLRSIVTYDRRGDVIALDDFEDGRRAWLLQGSAGYDVLLTRSRARSGCYSAKLVTAGAWPNWTGMTANYVYPALSNLGFELSFHGGVGAGLWEFRTYLYDGVNQARLAIRFMAGTAPVSYRDSVGNWIPFTTPIAAPDFNYVFYTIKVIVDPTTNKYVRVLLNDRSYSLAGISPELIAWATAPQVEMNIYLEAGLITSGSLWIDDFILTQNEPA
jgi:hypothetical protein